MSESTPTTKTVEKTAGLLAEYETPAAIFKACERVRDAGYTKWDAHTPFPVHGLDDAMGLKPTPLGWISFAGGLTGGSLAVLMQWWMNAYDYALNIGGKPYFALPAVVPVTFELTILLTAFATIFGMLGINKLPTLYHWTFNGSRFGRVTDDRFFISIEADDPKFNLDATKRLLEKTEPVHLEEVKEIFVERKPLNLEGAADAFEALTGVSAPFDKKTAKKDGDEA
ncbi:MAG: DUF3341 domain-containing protein [Polyangiaceae bacterium]|nr:DUF3341 domain-containing protein [Polyangiaceae bacterium]